MTRFANAVFVFGLIASIAVLAFVIHGSDRFLNSTARTAFFAGVPVLGIVTAIVCLRLSDAVKAVVAVTLVATACGVYMAEAFLLYQHEHNVVPKWAPAGFDSRTKYEVVTELRQKGINAYPSVFPAYFMNTQLDGSLRSPVEVGGREVLPLGGIAMAPTVLCNESGSYVVFDSDRQGFNNPDAVWDQLPAEVMAVGDSFAQGYCVPPPRHFMGIIQARIARTINLSVSGNGPLMELATLLEYGPPLRPKTVLWFFFEGNDIQGNQKIERRSPMLNRYLAGGIRQGLLENSAAVTKAYRHYIDAKIAEEPNRRDLGAGPLQTVISFIGLAELRKKLGGDGTNGSNDYGLFADIVAKARDATAAWGGRLVLVYLPTAGRFVPGDKSEVPALDDMHARVLTIAGQAGVAVVDMLPAFAGHADPASLFPFRRPGHYNQAGHALVADQVLRALGAPKP